MLHRAIFLGCIYLLACAAHASDWPTYAGQEGGDRYSTANQITPDNVEDLELAWQYRTGDLEGSLSDVCGRLLRHAHSAARSGRSAPGTCTPIDRVIALDPVTGAERWIFDPEIKRVPFAGRFNCQRTTYWQDPQVAAGEACEHRLILATNDP